MQPWGSTSAVMSWSVMERDCKEGMQVSGDDTWIPWRETTKARKSIMDRKLMIYSLLEAGGENLDDFVKPYYYEEKAQAASEKSKSNSGNNTTVVSQPLKMFAQGWKERSLTPMPYEQNVLKWQLTSKAKKQGSSKQKERSNAGAGDTVLRWQRLPSSLLPSSL